MTEGFEFDPNRTHCTLSKWIVDPTDRESINDIIFIKQINYKKQLLIQLELTKHCL